MARLERRLKEHRVAWTPLVRVDGREVVHLCL
jgi:hypothetical protein